MKICKLPFEQIEIHDNGESFCCCPQHTNFLSFGNFHNLKFEDIWNSEAAIDLRTKILNGDHSLCRTDVCEVNKIYTNVEYNPIIHKPKTDIYPKRVFLGHDSECNVYCLFCRDEIRKNSPQELIKKNKLIDSTYLPLLKDAEIVHISAKGDPFSSPHSLKLIRSITENYPNIKFYFTTNGIRCSEKIFKALGIMDKINGIQVSLHSATKKTYNKIVRGGDFTSVLNNLEFLSSMVKNKQIDTLCLGFVVTSLNYHEMPKFIEFAEKYNATPMFWQYQKWGALIDKNYEHYAIYEPTHKDHEKLLEVLCHENFKKSNIYYQFGFETIFNKIK